jgi:hypothetical protein
MSGGELSRLEVPRDLDQKRLTREAAGSDDPSRTPSATACPASPRQLRLTRAAGAAPTAAIPTLGSGSCSID